MKVNAGCRGRYISSAFICIVINRVFICLGSACVKLMSSVGESRGQILTLVRIYMKVVKGIQEHHDIRLIHLCRSKYFSLNNKTHLDRSKLDRSTLDRTWFDLV